MNNKGFTLVEMLVCVVLLVFVLTLGIIASRDTLATSLSRVSTVSDNQIKEAARLYATKQNKRWVNGTTCVTVSELVDYGYLEYKEVSDEIDQIIQIARDTKKKTILSIDYVDSCEY